MLFHIIIRFLELVPVDPETMQAKFELFTYKDKLLREIIILQNEANPEDFTKVIFEARVLGKFCLYQKSSSIDNLTQIMVFFQINFAYLEH